MNASHFCTMRQNRSKVMRCCASKSFPGVLSSFRTTYNKYHSNGYLEYPQLRKYWSAMHCHSQLMVHNLNKHSH